MRWMLRRKSKAGAGADEDVFVKDTMKLPPRLPAEQCRKKIRAAVTELEHTITRSHNDLFVPDLVKGAGLNPLMYHLVLRSKPDDFDRGWRDKEAHLINLEKVKTEYLAYLKQRQEDPDASSYDRENPWRRLLRSGYRSERLAVASERWEGLLLTLAYLKRYPTFLSYKRCLNMDRIAPVVATALQTDTPLLLVRDAATWKEKRMNAKVKSCLVLAEKFEDVKKRQIRTVFSRYMKEKQWASAVGKLEKALRGIKGF